MSGRPNMYTLKGCLSRQAAYRSPNLLTHQDNTHTANLHGSQSDKCLLCDYSLQYLAHVLRKIIDYRLQNIQSSSASSTTFCSILSSALSQDFRTCSIQASLQGASSDTPSTDVTRRCAHTSKWLGITHAGRCDITSLRAQSFARNFQVISSHAAPTLPYYVPRRNISSYRGACGTSMRLLPLPMLQRVCRKSIIVQKMAMHQRRYNTKLDGADLPPPSSSDHTTPSGKRRSLLMQKIYDEFNPNSERWKLWNQELQLIGYTNHQAKTLLSAHPKQLQFTPAGTALRFHSVMSLIVSETNLTVDNVLHMAKHHPYIMRTSPLVLTALIAWFKAECGFTSAQVGSVLYRCPTILSYRKLTLQERLNVFLARGVPASSLGECLARTPTLFKHSRVDLVERLNIMYSLFGVSGLQVLQQHPTALLQPKTLFKERVAFLRHLGYANPTLANMWCGNWDVKYATRHLKSHQASCGKPLPQLCHELKLLAGMPEVFEDLKLQPDTMSELQYYQAFVKWLPTQAT